ncbi:MAG: glycosyl transferase family 2, partial [Odoribacter sp.]|nr:glycosyl transferase family 2 [Odoribacter sp.]
YWIGPVCLLALLFFVDSLRLNKNLKVASLSVIASFIQLTAYGTGFIHAVILYAILRRQPRGTFIKNFYK